jgi:tetratricopeptide (TPR) repeat protein
MTEIMPQATLNELEHHLNQWRENGDYRRAANTISQIVGVLFSARNWTACVDWLRQEIVLREQIADKRGLGNAFHNLGRVFSAWGKSEDSCIWYRNVISIAEELQDRHLQSQGLCDLAAVLAKSGEVLNALAAYRQALAIQASLLDVAAQMNTLSTVGYLHIVNREPEKASGYLQQALEMHRACHDGKGDPTTLIRLGKAYVDLTRVEDAIDCWNEAASIFHDLGEAKLEADVRRALQNLDQALRNSS